MDHKLHFISGLPRAGSTLLAAILRQNPKILAGMSGPLAGLVSSLMGNMSQRNEYAVFINSVQRKRILRDLCQSYYADQKEEVILDSNRVWCARMDLLGDLFPDSRIIACVRHVPWVIDSIERLVRSNPFSPSSIFNYSAGGTVYTRANALTSPEGLVGHAYDALKEAFYGELAGHMMILQYETLVRDPEHAIAAVYKFIGEAPYSHNFDRIEYDASAFDERAGTPGLHHVRPKVEVAERETVLPPDLFGRFEKGSFWRSSKTPNPHGVEIV